MKFILPAINDREKCINDGCNNKKQFMGTYRKDGTAQFRRFCTACHYQRQAEKKGLTPTQWANAFHPYRKHRKDYCENIDGRLGFKCTTNIVWDGMLDTDHINGDPSDNRPENMQTLCKCCHAYKGNINEDYASPGRKAISVAKKQQIGK